LPTSIALNLLVLASLALRYGHLARTRRVFIDIEVARNRRFQGHINENLR
jgi:hypothetical protein